MKKIFFLFLFTIVSYQLFIKDSSTFKEMSLFNNAPTLSQQIPLDDSLHSSGNLILINKQTHLQKEPAHLSAIPIDLAENVQIDSDYFVEKELIAHLHNMFEAAANDGIHHFTINSAYRSGTLQQQLFEKSGADYALPAGFSEHQSGLALDIGSTQGTMDHAAEGKWLANHAADFGFILRYPENKVAVTGIAYEPWHFRYVGKPHSWFMQQNGYALEEYLDVLKNKKQLQFKLDGLNYYVQYIEPELAKQGVVNIPDTANFTISSDNLGGFIITSLIK